LTRKKKKKRKSEANDDEQARGSGNTIVVLDLTKDSEAQRLFCLKIFRELRARVSFGVRSSAVFLCLLHWLLLSFPLQCSNVGRAAARLLRLRVDDCRDITQSSHHHQRTSDRGTKRREERVDTPQSIRNSGGGGVSRARRVARTRHVQAWTARLGKHKGEADPALLIESKRGS
jgi:hypothetical protein